MAASSAASNSQPKPRGAKPRASRVWSTNAYPSPKRSLSTWQGRPTPDCTEWPEGTGNGGVMRTCEPVGVESPQIRDRAQQVVDELLVPARDERVADGDRNLGVRLGGSGEARSFAAEDVRRDRERMPRRRGGRAGVIRPEASDRPCSDVSVLTVSYTSSASAWKRDAGSSEYAGCGPGGQSPPATRAAAVPAPERLQRREEARRRRHPQAEADGRYVQGREIAQVALAASVCCAHSSTAAATSAPRRFERSRTPGGRAPRRPASTCASRASIAADWDEGKRHLSEVASAASRPSASRRPGCVPPPGAGRSPRGHPRSSGIAPSPARPLRRARSRRTRTPGTPRAG
jgi:hypothetical protein